MSQTEIDRICDRYVDDLARLSPTFATSLGITEYDDSWADYSPAGIDRATELDRAFLAAVQAAPVASDNDAITLDAVTESVGVDLDLAAALEPHRAVNNIACPPLSMRDAFAGMPTGSATASANIVARMGKIPTALEQYRESLRYAQSHGKVAPIRQIQCLIDQATALTQDAGYLDRIITDATAPGSAGADLAEAGARALGGAKAAYADLVTFLRTELAPHAPDADACGRERYQLLSQSFVGARVDLDEAYEWGCQELARIDAQQAAVARELYGPGVSVREALDRLNADPNYTIHGVGALQEWMQHTADSVLADMNGTHFDIPPEVATIECMIDGAGTGGIYYTGPAADFSRPGRMWWSVPPGEEDFHTWQELTTVYHEGVPGHHLQIGIATASAQDLNRWRRLACWNSGYGEGWALYAEDLMDKLGYHDDPGTRMGMLDGQRLRAARVMLDIGVHLGKQRPDGGGVWDGDYAWQFLTENVAMTPGFLRFECDRYLGWPGQAPSYKLGQRLWEQLRDDYIATVGAGCPAPLRQFHAQVLPLGALPLATLRRAVLGSGQ